MYRRISETDEEFDKVENQESVLREFCAKQGYAIVADYFDDGLSAWRDDVYRPAWHELLKAIPSGRFDVVVATFENRLTRQTSEKVELLGVCRVAGVTWHTVHNGMVDPTSSDQSLLAIIKGWQAETEVSDRIKAQKQRFDAQRAAGLPLWGGRPFGFHLDRRTHFHGTAENPVDEAAEVVWAYEQVAAGATIYSVIKSWNARGIHTTSVDKEGGRRMWSYASLQQLLKRPRNAALMEVDGAIDYGIECQWEPLVDRGLWELVRAKVTKDPADVRRQFEPKWLLAGIARCGLCSQPLRSAVGSDRKTSFPVYRCKRSMLPAIPPEFYPNGKKIRHASAKSVILDKLARDAVVAAFMFAPGELLPSETGSTSDLRRVQVELQRVKEKLIEVTEELDDDSSPFDRSTLRAKAEKHRQRAEELDADIARIIKADANSAMMIESRSAMFRSGRVSFEDAATLMSELEERFDSLPLLQRRRLVLNLLDVVVYPGRKSDRFVIWHKVATSLNAEGDEAPDFLRPVQLAVSIRGLNPGI